MRKRALVIEPDLDVRDLVVMCLEMAGLDAVSVGTGAAALRMARELDLALVTLALALPDMDGLDVCRRLRALSDAGIMIITSRDEDVVRLSGREAGADAYLPKPFSPLELRTKAAVLLRPQ